MPSESPPQESVTSHVEHERGHRERRDSSSVRALSDLVSHPKGNSGGPLYDQHANLIGIVTSKLPPIRGAERENDIFPENVNFGVRTGPLLDLCPSYSDLRVLQDESRVSNHPIVLGKLMQQLCAHGEVGHHKAEKKRRGHDGCGSMLAAEELAQVDPL